MADDWSDQEEAGRLAEIRSRADQEEADRPHGPLMAAMKLSHLDRGHTVTPGAMCDECSCGATFWPTADRYDPFMEQRVQLQGKVASLTQERDTLKAEVARLKTTIRKLRARRPRPNVGVVDML